MCISPVRSLAYCEDRESIVDFIFAADTEINKQLKYLIAIFYIFIIITFAGSLRQLFRFMAFWKRALHVQTPFHQGTAALQYIRTKREKARTY